MAGTQGNIMASPRITRFGISAMTTRALKEMIRAIRVERFNSWTLSKFFLKRSNMNPTNKHLLGLPADRFDGGLAGRIDKGRIGDGGEGFLGFEG